MIQDRKEIFSERIAAGSRTYYFDVKISSDGTRYLTIDEVRDSQRSTKHRVMVFQENIEKFMEALHGANRAMIKDAASESDKEFNKES